MTDSRLVVALVLMLSSACQASMLVDEIVAKVNGSNICYSDLNEKQMSLNGRVRSIAECVQDELFMQKAKDFGAIMRDDELEKRMVALRAGYGFGYKTQAEFEAFLRKSGLSSKRLKEQIRRNGSIVSVQAALAPKDALVTRQDVEVYCLAHPREKEEEYLLSFASGARDLLTDDGSVPAELVLSWSEFDTWMNKSDLSQSMNFVKKMKVGEISEPIVRDDTFFVYRLEKKNEKRLFSIDERYADVEKSLLKERKAEKEVETKERLRLEAAISVLA